MKAVLLAAGLGTRLRPITNSQPKCLVEINGKPLELKKAYKVGTQSFLSQGGDLYKTFLKGKYKDRKVNLSEEIIDYLKLNKEIKKPKGGRLIPVQ